VTWLVALVAAVAGGQLAVSMTPPHPRVGQRVDIAMTGEVGDRGHLYVYRNLSRRCAATVSGERGRGKRLASWPIDAPFEKHVRFAGRRSSWVCVYLYAITCDAAGNNCAPALGLPPDAGFAQVRVRVRPVSQSVKSAAGSGLVIT
jgi:hypothetical protein